MIIIFSRSVRRSVRGSANPAGISFSVFCPRYPNANYADRKKKQQNNKVDARYRKKERKNCLLSFHSNKCGMIKFVSCVALSVRVVEPTEGRTIIEHKLCSSFAWVWFYRLARQMFWLFAGELYCCITNGSTLKCVVCV